jgi:hypothetical protein
MIEHLDAPRLSAFERVLFEFAHPAYAVVTTPNSEYNSVFETLPAGQFRHRDHRFEWTRAEFEQWALSHDTHGLIGTITARADAQTRRLALLYALMDESPVIREEHLRAACALWGYAEESVRYIFGSFTGNDRGDRILEILTINKGRMSTTDISNALGRNVSSADLNQTLQALQSDGLIGSEKEKGERGAPKTWWFAQKRSISS